MLGFLITNERLSRDWFAIWFELTGEPCFDIVGLSGFGEVASVGSKELPSPIAPISPWTDTKSRPAKAGFLFSGFSNAWRRRWPWSPCRQRRLSDFAKQIHPPRSRPSSRRFISPRRSAVPAHDALVKAAYWAFNRSKVCRCIPLGLPPSGFAIPAPHPSRRRMVSARRIARSSSASLWHS